ncbi:VPLPA-CTERM protein sorting domain-containing protein [Roseovarius litoreus]|uniref:VPLPA-CTERM protein sorting domain-containing protein n=1 Tax=Roseovarius litoreus TaxID=1155722 RepID=A0A1M7CKL2_9RHOB|nr:VPLPA-CTERM sorting domain-containing protein [Roseovarius litoreus]SHL67801.1 VPLPA-CTERM protein sorting domain-containing protein [Roseovarius litoreus]
MSIHSIVSSGVIATILSTTAALATTVSTATVTSANQGCCDPVTITTDTQTVSDGTATATLGASSAIQNADGTSAVSAVIDPFSRNSGSTRVTSEAQLDFSETNATNGTRTYTLDFTLSGLSTEISTSRQYGANLTNPFANPDPGVVDTESAYTAASFEYAIQINGTEIFNARADVLGLATFNASFDLVQTYIFDNVQNFTPSITPLGLGGGFIEAFEFSVDDLSGSIALGDFGAGETFDITSTLTARAFATNFEGENAVGAFVQDPITISSFGLRSQPTVSAPIPLPAAGWLLLGALGGLAAMKRRKTV